MAATGKNRVKRNSDLTAGGARSWSGGFGRKTKGTGGDNLLKREKRDKYK